MLFPNEDGISIELESNVYETFGEQIKQVITDTLLEHGLKNVYVKAVDKGALDFTIRARMITAIKRGINDEL
jgi:citrate lyase subunit gamma (acyl carrier protein)